MYPFTAVGLAYLLCTSSVFASPLHSRYSEYSVKDSHQVPPGWSNIGSAPPNHVIRLQIGLKQGQFEDLERHLYEGSLCIPQVLTTIP